MSTKNLAKTVIEGGRRNKWERKQSSADERARARDYCKRVTIDPDYADEDGIEEREHVYKDFSDNLGPVYRWLDSQDGRPWSEVRSEVFQKFDTRTTAGRHITFDHILRDVVDTQSGFDKSGRIVDPAIPKESTGKSLYYHSYYNYYVDQSGIFHKQPEGRRHHYYTQPPTQQELIDAGKWLDGRMIMEDGGKLHWVLPQEGIWLSSWFDPNGTPYDPWGRRHSLGYYLRDNGHHEVNRVMMYGSSKCELVFHVHSDFWNKIENPFSFRERGPLNDEEVKHFNALHSRIKEDILSATKGR
jgi:hypothetical protein